MVVLDAAQVARQLAVILHVGLVVDGVPDGVVPGAGLQRSHTGDIGRHLDVEVEVVQTCAGAVVRLEDVHAHAVASGNRGVGLLGQGGRYGHAGYSHIRADNMVVRHEANFGGEAAVHAVVRRCSNHFDRVAADG